MSEFILEARNIIKTFPGVKAVDDVSMHVKKGEIMGLIGENGAGKSTILKVINGIYKSGSFKGTIVVNGSEVEFSSPHDALRKGIGFVPQEINVMNDLTVAENIFVGHLSAGNKSFTNPSELNKRTTDFLEKNKIKLSPRMRVRMLSIGQKQLLMIARALSWEPEVLILDEPTTALSKEDVENLFHIIRDLKQRGTSIVFVTHKLEEILALTDSVTILRDGKKISVYNRDEYDTSIIVRDMVGREITNMYPQRSTQIGDELLRIENLTVEHPKIQDRNLIEDISFTLKKGEVLGIAGLVGSGRSETLNAIFGKYPVKSGKTYLNNEEIRIQSCSDAIRNGIALVSEDRKTDGLLMLANIKHNIVLSNLKKILKGLIINKKLENDVSNEYMKSLNIKATGADTMVVNLSGGNQQKVVLAKALNSEPKILILDEPTKGIDVGSKNEIYNLINKLVSMGISIIMVSSELPELIAMCDRFIVLAGGRMVGELSKDEASQEAIMMKCCL
jgi:ABC-type sugar transport system ATPase subunit